MSTPHESLPGRLVATTRRAGTKHVGRQVVVFQRRRKDDGPARVAVVATRAVGGAVQRNQAKRYLREAVRAVDLPTGTDLVLHARARTARAGTATVTADLRTVLEAAS